MFKAKHFIDVHKCSNAVVVLGMIWHAGAWTNTTAWVYLALHGSYGFLWALKSRIFGDKQWEQPMGVPMGVATWGVLSLYWVAPYLITARGTEAPPWFLALAVGAYAFGIFLHFASDMQKHLWLARPRPELLMTGLWSRTRNPNYLGELLIYVSFTSLALHWLPLTLLAGVIAVVWVPNMLKKDRSLARYPEFETYRARSGLLFPRILPVRPSRRAGPRR
jgi:protein-S-isoprenylcysteine O-methyltransferase Ste14